MEKKKPLYFFGLDSLRVGLAIDATFFHTLFFGTRPMYMMYEHVPGQAFTPDVPQILTINFFFLAIPSFFTLSFILYAVNWKGRNGYFKKRIGQLGLLTLFWVLVRVVQLLITDPGWFARMMDSPIHGVMGVLGAFGSLYWFFISLLILTVVLHGWLEVLNKIEKNKLTWMWGTFLGSVVLMMSIPYWIPSDFFGNPMPFLPYVFATPLIIHYYQEWSERKTSPLNWIFLVFGVLWLFFSWLDWQIQPHYAERGFLVFVLPFYIRLSLMFGCFMLIFAAIRRRKSTRKWVKFFGDYSLGIYCLHLFVPFTLTFQEALLGWGVPQLSVEALMLGYRIGGAMLMTWLLRFIPFMRRFI